MAPLEDTLRVQTSPVASVHHSKSHTVHFATVNMALTFKKESEFFLMKRIKLDMDLTCSEMADWKIATLKNEAS